MSSPAATGSTASVFVIETSAEAVTAVPSVEASFPFEGSVVVVETVAVFDSGSVRAGWTVTTSVRVAGAPGPRSGAAQRAARRRAGGHRAHRPGHGARGE